MESKAIIIVLMAFIIGASVCLLYGLINLLIWILGCLIVYPVQSLIVTTLLTIIGLTIEKYVSRT